MSGFDPTLVRGIWEGLSPAQRSELRFASTSDRRTGPAMARRGLMEASGTMRRRRFTLTPLGRAVAKYGKEASAT